MKVFFNWLVFILIVAGIIAAVSYRHWIGQHLPLLPEMGRMTGLQVLFFALALAFLWVDVLRWGSVKPFNCLKCMCGWIAVILAFTFHVQFWYFYLSAGLLVGATFEGLRMRWL